MIETPLYASLHHAKKTGRIFAETKSVFAWFTYELVVRGGLQNATNLVTALDYLP